MSVEETLGMVGSYVAAESEPCRFQQDLGLIASNTIATALLTL